MQLIIIYTIAIRSESSTHTNPCKTCNSLIQMNNSYVYINWYTIVMSIFISAFEPLKQALSKAYYTLCKINVLLMWKLSMTFNWKLYQLIWSLHLHHYMCSILIIFCRKLYWSDIVFGHIVQANYDGSSAVVIANAISSDGLLLPLTFDEDGISLLCIFDIL